MRKGAAMVKIFPGALGGPKYMTNLKMVFPEVNLIHQAELLPKTLLNLLNAVPAQYRGLEPLWILKKLKKKDLFRLQIR